MKPRRFSPAVLVLLLAIIGAGVWWVTRSQAATLESTTKAPMPAKAGAPALSTVETPAPPAQRTIAPPSITPPAMATPVALPASKPDANTVDPTKPTAAPSPDPYARSIVELRSLNFKIASLLHNGDQVQAYQILTPPNKFDPRALQALQTTQEAMQRVPADQINPFLLQLREESARSYEELEDQVPTFNAAGNEATYTITFYGPGGRIPDRQTTVTFVKINGQWYRK